MTEEKLNKANELQHKIKCLSDTIDDISHSPKTFLTYISYDIKFDIPLNDTLIKVIVEHLEKDLSEAKKEFEEL